MNPTLARKLETLPDGPGVYLWKDAAGAVLYVGKAKNLRSRVRSYLMPDRTPAYNIDEMVRRAADVDTIVVPDEKQSLLLENNLIKEYQPRFNVRLKDDKSYPSIAVTLGEPFPRVFATRRRDHAGARYFGPYTDVADMRRTLGLVRRMFTVRSCLDDIPRERRERPCLDFHIGRCLAPCVGRQDEGSYRAMIAEVVEFLEGRTVDLKTRIRDMMQDASAREDFERARDLRDTLKWLDQVERPAAVEVIGTGDADVIGYARDGEDAVAVLMRVRDGRVIGREHRFLECPATDPDGVVLETWLVGAYRFIEGRARRLVLPFPLPDLAAIEEIFADQRLSLPSRGVAARWVELAEQNARHLLESFLLESFETDERAEDPVYALGRELGLTVVPRTFICVDISTNQGRDTVGSLVTFEAGRPRKSEYRKYRIKGEAQQDDFAAIHEVITRYVRRRLDEGLPMPDLIVIDGGKGQLGAARAALEEAGLAHLPLASLAKRDEEVYLPGRSEPLRLPRRHPALRLLQRARDEAHRYGVAYSRARRSARTITSALLDIPGVGPSRRTALLQAFGSLAGVRSASVPEIAALPGFSTTLAERVLEHVKKG
ncbi:MAG: excinuclease ABC subunit UvrC [Gemmatimonadetes bacterium]|nr:excinuclease ABC subunit UvrC [Gemmatimonadota bacterium]MCB9518181.1 excinuclease ABC subunit UvrC [Gemmatimonadales bacterium]